MELFGIWLLFLYTLPLARLQILLNNSCQTIICADPGLVCVKGACLPLEPVPATTQTSNPCTSNPCMNGCECKQSCKHSNGYYCESPNGYIGKNCNIEVPKLDCSSDRITISVESEFFDDLYPSQLDVGCLYIGQDVGQRGNKNNTCKVCYADNTGYYNISMFLPFTQCGGKMNSSGGMVSFGNMLWAGLKDVDIYDVPVPIMRFQCTYDQEYNIFTSLKPMIEEWRIGLNDSMKLKAGIELCKIGNACPAACPPLYTVKAGAFYTVSETIHSIMSIESSYLTNGNNVVTLDFMYLSCSSEYSEVLSNSDVALVLGGCETNLLTSSINRLRSNARVVCVSFKVPRLLQCKDLFYIHAKLSVVEQLNAPICLGTNNLKPKRSVEYENPDKTVVMAIPIRVIEGSDGIPSDSELFPADEVDRLRLLELNSHTTAENHQAQAASINQTLIIGSVVLSVLLFLILIIAFLSYYCSV